MPNLRSRFRAAASCTPVPQARCASRCGRGAALLWPPRPKASCIPISHTVAPRTRCQTGLARSAHSCRARRALRHARRKALCPPSAAPADGRASGCACPWRRWRCPHPRAPSRPALGPSPPHNHRPCGWPRFHAGRAPPGAWAGPQLANGPSRRSRSHGRCRNWQTGISCPFLATPAENNGPWCGEHQEGSRGSSIQSVCEKRIQMWRGQRIQPIPKWYAYIL